MTDTAVEKAKGAAEDVGVGGDDGNNGNGNLTKKLLIPAAAGLGTLAATMAAKKAPDLFRNHVMPKVEEKGADEVTKIGEKAAGNLQGQGGVVGAVAGKAREKLGGGGGREKTRRLPIQRWTDIALPVEDVYEKWVDFDEYPKFMHRVLEVKQDDDDKNKVHWREKIWFSTREWDAEITDKRQNDRIAWKSVSGTHHSGVVSFHRLDKNLTRILVTVDFVPSGMVEKMASGMRFVKRAVQADLARFKAYIEFGDAKELEYRAQPEEMEQHRSGDDDEAEETQDREEPKGEDDSSDENDDDRESDRRERESRRQERREALSSS